MKLSKIAFRILLVLLGVVLGVFACNYTYFVFEKDISYFDLFSLIVTTGLGFYLAVVISRVSNKQNSEKTLLIAEIKDSIIQVDKISKIASQRSYPLFKMVGEVKSLNEDLHLIEKLISNSHCNQVKTSELRKSFGRFRAYATGMSPGVNDSISLTNAQINILGNHLRHLKQQYFEVIFMINKS